MEVRTLGKTGLHVSVIGFGGAEVGYLNTEQQQAAEVLNLLLDQGVSVVDTAAMYRGSEELIGRSIAHRRAEFVLISKCGQAFPDLEGEAWSPQVITHTIERSLWRLGTDHIDVMLLHSCDLATLKRGEALGALVEAQKAGKVRFVGYSGDNEDVAYAAELPEVDVIETSINMCDQRNIDVVLPHARENHVGVIAKRPIANAAWKPRDSQPGLYADYAAEYSRRFEAMGLDPRALGFEGPAAEVWPEIALRFTLSLSGVHTAIVGTTNAQHVRANREAAAKGPLPQETVDQLRAAFGAAELKASETWLGQM